MEGVDLARNVFELRGAVGLHEAEENSVVYQLRDVPQALLEVPDGFLHLLRLRYEGVQLPDLPLLVHFVVSKILVHVLQFGNAELLQSLFEGNGMEIIRLERCPDGS